MPLVTLGRAGLAGIRIPGAALAHLKKHAHGAAKKKGAPPGTVVYVGPERTEAASLSFMRYDEESFREKGLATGESVTVEEAVTALQGPETGWVNLDGIHDVELVKAACDSVGVHRLIQEDIVHSAQRAKLEEYPDHLFVVLRMLEWDGETDTLQDEQLSLVLGRGYVLTFQEHRGDVFDGVRNRLRNASGMIRTRGADYLAYALVDSVVDHYFHVMEAVSDRIEVLEIEVLENPDPAVVGRIHRLKREMLAVRRAIWPLREVLNQLYRGETDLVQEPTRIFVRDVYDHAVQIIDTVETMRDLLGGLMDLYLTGVSNRMNEVMKVLTIIATIFIPLSFLAGLYGMNFQVMPELSIPWAYPALLCVMAAVGGGMLIWFKRKGWIWS